MEINDIYYGLLKSFFIKYILRKRVTRTVDYTYGLIVKRIFVYEDISERRVFLGQATPWGDILMPEYVFNDYSDRAFDYIFLHELGHTNVNAVFRGIYYILFMSFSCISLFSILKLLTDPILLITQHVSIGSLTSIMINRFYTAILSGFIGMISSWSYELNAELFAYRMLGKSAYIEVKNELRDNRQEVGFLTRIILKYYLSPPKRLFWILAELR